MRSPPKTERHAGCCKKHNYLQPLTLKQYHALPVFLCEANTQSTFFNAELQADQELTV